MNRSLTIASITYLTVSQAMAITYTGNAEEDFFPFAYTILVDGANDVGLPPNAPIGTISGWDIDRVYFLADPVEDAWHFGIRFRGIGGDADGDGIDGQTSFWLAMNGGHDLPHLVGTEAICLVLDVNQDGAFDLFAGVPGFSDSLDGFVVAEAAQPPIPAPPCYWVGAELPEHTGPHCYAPPAQDFEFSITNVHDLLAPFGPVFDFDIVVYAGSELDDGIGEDLLVGSTHFVMPRQPVAPVVSIAADSDQVTLNWSVVDETVDGDPIEVLFYEVLGTCYSTGEVYSYDEVWGDTTYVLTPVPIGSICYTVRAAPNPWTNEVRSSRHPCSPRPVLGGPGTETRAQTPATDLFTQPWDD